jgi:hypothetical protein
MAENMTADFGTCDFKEAVCIDAGRIYDSCSDKDCLSDLRVLFPEAIQRSVIDIATSAKIKKVTVLNVLIDVENVPFNKGFYSVDMTYYFEVTAEVTTPQSPCVTVVGVAVASKKAILFGSDGNVRIFESNGDGEVVENNNMPTAKVQVVDALHQFFRFDTGCRGDGVQNDVVTFGDVVETSHKNVGEGAGSAFTSFDGSTQVAGINGVFYRIDQFRGHDF